MKSALVLARVPVRAVGVEWARVLALRAPDLQAPALIGGRLALCLPGAGRRPAALGLGTSRLPERPVGGAAPVRVLLLPAVAAAGLLLAAWRRAVRDLVGPIAGHVVADLAL